MPPPNSPRNVRVRIDPSVVRGLEYYTGPVFEADLSFEVKDEEGRPVRFGSVGGGGRYDGLVGRFMKQDVPATGFSVGVSRLQAALAVLGKGGARQADGALSAMTSTGHQPKDDPRHQYWKHEHSTHYQHWDHEEGQSEDRQRQSGQEARYRAEQGNGEHPDTCDGIGREGVYEHRLRNHAQG